MLVALACTALVFRPSPVLRPLANVRAVGMSLGEGPMSLDDGAPPVKSSSSDALRAEIAAKKQAAGDALELSQAELDLALSSLQQAGSATHDDVDWPALRALLARSAHLPHKDWARTEAAAAELEGLLSDPADATFRDLFHRVLTDGNWPVAEQAATSRTAKPWVVLVTGVNGIREQSTTSPNPSPSPTIALAHHRRQRSP